MGSEPGSRDTSELHGGTKDGPIVVTSVPSDGKFSLGPTPGCYVCAQMTLIHEMLDDGCLDLVPCVADEVIMFHHHPMSVHEVDGFEEFWLTEYGQDIERHDDG